MPDIATGLIVGGTLFSAREQRRAGKAQQGLSEMEAQQLERNAKEAVAVSQRKALEQRRQFDLLQSRALALAGSGASDPQIMRLISELAGEGAYRASVELYEGQSEARNLRAGAVARRAEGAEAARAGRAQALGTLISGAGSLYGRFGGGGPTQSPAPIEERNLFDL